MTRQKTRASAKTIDANTAAQILLRAEQPELKESVARFFDLDKDDTFAKPTKDFVQSLLRFGLIMDSRTAYAELRNAVDVESLESFRALEAFFETTGLSEEDFTATQDTPYDAYFSKAIADQTRITLAGDGLDKYDTLYHFASDIGFLFNADFPLDKVDGRLNKDVAAYFKGDDAAREKLGEKGKAGKICAAAFNKFAAETRELTEAVATLEQATERKIDIEIDKTLARNLQEHVRQVYKQSREALQSLKDIFTQRHSPRVSSDSEPARRSRDSMDEWGYGGGPVLSHGPSDPWEPYP